MHEHDIFLDQLVTQKITLVSKYGGEKNKQLSAARLLWQHFVSHHWRSETKSQVHETEAPAYRKKINVILAHQTTISVQGLEAIKGKRRL